MMLYNIVLLFYQGFQSFNAPGYVSLMRSFVHWYISLMQSLDRLYFVQLVIDVQQ